MLEQLAKNDFAAHVHSKFQVHLQDRPPLELELYLVEDGHSTPAQEQFSLLFYGPDTFGLGQGTFEVEHGAIGRFQLFLVPIQPDQKGPRYQAVFNRFVNKQA